MLKKWSLLLAVLAFLLGTLLLLGPPPTRKPVAKPVDIRFEYITNKAEFNCSLALIPAFWITNHTDKTLGFTIEAIEIQRGQTWITNLALPFPEHLFFQKPGKLEGLLGPHTAAYGVVPYRTIALPTNEVWRARIAVSEKLEGLEDIRAGIIGIPKMWQIRQRTGNTNISIYPFTKGQTRWRHYSKTLTEEVQPR